MAKYAKGKRAWGICQRSGRRMLLSKMVADGYYPDLIVDPAWRDERHPQEHLRAVQDPTTLYRPSPMNLPPPSSPVLSSNRVVNDITLTWTASTTAASQISSYRLMRKIFDEDAGETEDDADWVVISIVTLVRDWDTAILGPALEYTDAGVDLTAGTHQYQVEAVAEQGPPSDPSNVEDFPQE